MKNKKLLPDYEMGDICLRTIIAEICGWKDIQMSKRSRVPMGLNPESRGVAVSEIPDYLKDMNAMHKSIKSQLWTATQEQKFQTELYNIFARKGDGFRDGAQVIVNADARDWAEAFVKTMDRWKIDLGEFDS